MGAVALMSLWLWLIDRRNKGAAAWGIHRAATVLAIFMVLLLVSCSGPTAGQTLGSVGSATNVSSSPAPPASSPGTPAGQYFLTLTATFGTVTESIPLSLTVQ